MHPYGFDLSTHEALSTRSKITFLMSALRKNRLQKKKKLKPSIYVRQRYETSIERTEALILFPENASKVKKRSCDY